MNIVSLPDRVLREQASEVPLEEITSPQIQRLIGDMDAALRRTEDGVGIAAPQIGVSRRVFLVSEEAKFIDSERTREKEHQWEYHVYINPVITKLSKAKVSDVEGCLSVPGKYGVVPRPEKVEIEAYDETGRKFSRGASRFFARVLQHEMDHLNGTLFIDKATEMLKRERNHEKI